MLNNTEMAESINFDVLTDLMAFLQKAKYKDRLPLRLLGKRK